jgi:hypothetical protein
VSKTGRFLFWPGQIVATPGAIEAFNASGDLPFDYLGRLQESECARRAPALPDRLLELRKILNAMVFIVRCFLFRVGNPLHVTVSKND